MIKWELINLNKNLQEFLDQLKDIESQMEQLEDMREAIFKRIDEELEAGETLNV
jgi:predicted phage-related endonuclease